MKYIRRTLEPVLLKAAGEFPVVMLTGPRQSGEDDPPQAPSEQKPSVSFPGNLRIFRPAPVMTPGDF